MPSPMATDIQLKLFAPLSKFLPFDSDRFPISSGETVQDVQCKI